MRRGIFAALVAASALSSSLSAAAPGAEAPTPHFVSLRAEAANGRRGPSLQSRIDWIYQRESLPLEVIGVNGQWRRVRDPDGVETWMFAQDLDERRTAYFKTQAALLREPHRSSAATAYIAAGVVGGLTACQGAWRRVAVGSHVGWVDKSALWGADTCAGV